MVRDHDPRTPSAKPTAHPGRNTVRDEWRGQMTHVRRELGLHDEFTKLCERYPHPGPATMAKLEALYLRMTGEVAPHLVDADSV